MLSDDRLTRMRDNAEHAYQLHMATGVSIDGAYPDLAHDYACDVPELLDENAALRERLAAAEHMLEAATEEIAAGREHLELAGREIEAAKQREQQARAIIELLATTKPRESEGWQQIGLFLVSRNVLWLRDQARAWLADHAEQRAPTEQEGQ